MADLPESATYDAGIYQIETTDPVIGGVNGESNKPTKNLANRTAYLKQRVDALEGAETVADHEGKTDPHSQYATDTDLATLQSQVDGLVNEQPFGAMQLPTVETADNRIAITAAVAVNGGTVTVPVNVPVSVGKEVTSGESGVVELYKTVAWSSPDLDINETYFIRFRVNAGALEAYWQKGSDADAQPGSLKGTPSAASGGGFDSTVLDMLGARVVTGNAGTLPVVTNLANADKLSFSAEVEVSLSGNIFVWTTHTGLAITLDWARAPVQKSVLCGFRNSNLDLSDGIDAANLTVFERLGVRADPASSRYISNSQVVFEVSAIIAGRGRFNIFGEA